MTTLERPEDSGNNAVYEAKLASLGLSAQFAVLANSNLFETGSLANRVALAASLSLLNGSRALVLNAKDVAEGLSKASENNFGYVLDLEIVKMQLTSLSSSQLNTRFRELLIDAATIDKELATKVKAEISNM